MIGRTNCTQKGGSPSEFVNIQMLTNQAEHSNLNGAVIRMSYETYSKQYTWDGKEITFSVPAHVSCTIEFPEVEGYKKPDNITFVAVEGNSKTIEAEYKAELVKVNVTSSNGSAVSGAKITINGKQQTWNGTEIRQLVPFGTQYSVVSGDVDGFGTPSTQTFTAQNPEREVSVVYIASSLKVNILSNQGTDATIANVKATVKYGSTSVQVANGGTVNLPTNTSVTISFPEVADYKKPADITYTHTGGLVEKSGTYQCELLTVNVSADSGSVSGFEVTISKQETVGVATKYTRLEYIESNGNQYIDTGYKAISENFKVVIDFEYTSVSSPKTVFGAQKGSNTLSFPITLYGKPAKFYVGNSLELLSYSIEANKRILLDSHANNGTLIVSWDGILNQASYSGSLCKDLSTYLFANNISGTADQLVSAKLYSCKIYDNGLLVRDYIPALRSDGIAGLYDAVNDTFIASNGTGNFAYGTIEPIVVSVQTSVTGSYKIPFDASYTIQASNVSGYTTPSSITRIASAVSYVIEQKYEVIKVKDLSLQDVYGNPINRSTANCYVIREAGQYKLPLVFGNAIKNGQVNAASYTKNGGAYSHNFVDGEGFVLTSPYIEVVNPHGIQRLTTNSDAENCMSDLNIIDGDICRYIEFTINSVPTEGANIVISAECTFKSVWNWHIWLWPHDLTPVEITNATGVKYNIMPVNLASKYDSDGVHLKNWFYQWGRAVPLLCPSAWNSTTDHTPGSITKSSRASDISFGIYNPTTFYYNSRSPYNWFGDKSYYNLWDAACTGTGASDNDTVKTVYDPCPVGWKIPNGNVFTGFSTSNVVGSFDGGWKFKRYSGDTVGVFFPASGWRSNSDGFRYNVGSYGYAWLSSARSQGFAYCMNFDSSNVVPQGNHRRACGLSVRPVQDDLTRLDTI